MFIQENAFESLVCVMATTLSRPQCVKYVKFQRDRQKKKKWILLIYQEVSQVETKCMLNSNNVPGTLKSNNHAFNSILKRTIREAKLKHYEHLFNQFRRDIIMAWKSILEYLCKSVDKRKELQNDYCCF